VPTIKAIKRQAINKDCGAQKFESIRKGAMSRASNAYVRDCYHDASRLNQVIAASAFRNRKRSQKIAMKMEGALPMRIKKWHILSSSQLSNPLWANSRLKSGQGVR